MKKGIAIHIKHSHISLQITSSSKQQQSLGLLQSLLQPAIIPEKNDPII